MTLNLPTGTTAGALDILLDGKKVIARIDSFDYRGVRATRLIDSHGRVVNKQVTYQSSATMVKLDMSEAEVRATPGRGW